MATIFYYDNKKGNDENDGLNKNKPKKNTPILLTPEEFAQQELEEKQQLALEMGFPEVPGV